MQKRKLNKHYVQTLNKVTEMIKLSPTTVLFRVFDISIQTIASFKAKELSHRQLVIASKELNLFLNNKSVKLPLRYCPYCTSSRVIQIPITDSTITHCKCLTCKRETFTEELEGGDVK